MMGWCDHEVILSNNQHGANVIQYMHGSKYFATKQKRNELNTILLCQNKKVQSSDTKTAVMQLPRDTKLPRVSTVLGSESTDKFPQ